jgi:hypothetical protein
MDDFVQRVNNEARALEVKIKALQDFVASPSSTFHKSSDYEQFMVMTQMSAMILYVSILNSRIRFYHTKELDEAAKL